MELAIDPSADFSPSASAAWDGKGQHTAAPAGSQSSNFTCLTQEEPRATPPCHLPAGTTDQ